MSRDADRLYAAAAAEYGAALERLARGYEHDPDRRRDLLQEIHVALWRSFGRFDGRCSIRTWVYRVAHNTATSLAIRRGQRTPVHADLDALDSGPDTVTVAAQMDRDLALARVYQLIHALPPVDRQVMLLYLEGVDANAIAEVTGLSGSNVATKIHRLKQMLVRRFHVRGADVR